MSRERPQADYKNRLSTSLTASRRVKCDWPAKTGVVPYKRSVHAATKERVVTKRIPQQGCDGLGQGALGRAVVMLGSEAPEKGALGRMGKHVSAARQDRTAEDRGAMAVHALGGRGYWRPQSVNGLTKEERCRD